MDENEFEIKSLSSRTNYLRNVLFFKCPPSVQRVIKDPNDYASCQELVEDLVKFPGIPDDIPATKHKCLDCDKPLSCPCLERPGKRKSLTPAAPSPAKKPTKTCSVHGLCNHDSSECLQLLKDKSATPNKSPAPKMCKFGCGQLYTVGHDCPSYKKKKDPSIRAIRIDDNAIDVDSVNQEDVIDHLSGILLKSSKMVTAIR